MQDVTIVELVKHHGPVQGHILLDDISYTCRTLRARLQEKRGNRAEWNTLRDCAKGRMGVNHLDPCAR
jgi:hypothetical protein